MANRVLLAGARDWVCSARIIATLQRAGLEVDVIAPRDSAMALSSLVRGVITVGPVDEDEVVCRVLDVADAYDRVVLCDEYVLTAAVESDAPGIEPLLPAPRAVLETLLDKTRFPDAARQGGLPVAPSVAASTSEAVVAAFAGVGGTAAAVKGRSGCGGAAVRRVASPDEAVAAAEELGYPVLVEEWLTGDLALMTCLFERGTPIAVFAAHKERFMPGYGPSTLLDVWEVDDALLDLAERLGSGFSLHGFVSVDLFRGDDGLLTVIELNPRPAAGAHISARFGVDFGRALEAALRGAPPARPSLPLRKGRVSVFPLELLRARREHGRLSGTLRWLVAPGALTQVPWEDPGVRRSLVQLVRS